MLISLLLGKPIVPYCGCISDVSDPVDNCCRGEIGRLGIESRNDAIEELFILLWILLWISSVFML